MKIQVLLQRRRRERSAPRIALFPFLAVLICTMGALVPLLFALARQARLQAAHDAAQRTAAKQTELRTRRDDVQWRTEQLKASRQETQSQLQQSRLYLGHIEDHRRRLAAQLSDLRATQQELAKSDAEDSQRSGQLSADFQQLRQQISDTQRQLETAQREAAGRQRSYAIVPYEGPNQTHRRPIYLECTAAAVILQPEGIRLTEEDFEGPMGPGNPLAAVLRATREYWISHAGFDPSQAGEAYPLLLVRQEGIAGYYAARAAMKSWGAEFGYELIDEDWKLKFPPPDRELARVVEQALEEARYAQRRLIAAAPREYSSSHERTIYRASGGQGVVSESVGDESRMDGPVVQKPNGPIGRQYQPRTGGPRGGSNSAGTVTEEQLASIYGGSDEATGSAAVGTGQAGGIRSAGISAGYPAGGGGGTAGVGGSYPGVGGRYSSGGGGFGLTGNGAAAPYGSPSGAPLSDATGLSSNAGNAAGQANPGSGQPDFGAPAVGGGVSSSGGPHTSNLGVAGGAPVASLADSSRNGAAAGPALVAPGYGSPSSSGRAPTDGGSTAPGTQYGSSSPVAASGVGNGGVNAGNIPADGSQRSAKPLDGYVVGQPHDPFAEPQPQPKSVPSPDTQVAMQPLRPGEWHEPPPKIDPPEPPKDKKDSFGGHDKHGPKPRGADWGLPDAAHGSVGITRPIDVDGFVDRLVIVPENGVRGLRVIALGGRTESAIDDLVSAVWAEMQSWGIAGKGMYWRPVLRVRVAPGGEGRFSDLEQLLQGSGIHIERRADPPRDPSPGGQGPRRSLPTASSRTA